MGMRISFVLVCAAALLLSARTAEGQRLRCLEPSEPRPADAPCVLRLQAGADVSDTVRLRLELPLGKARVGREVRVESSTGQVFTRRVTDQYGEVRIPWQGIVGPTVNTVEFVVEVDSVTIRRVIMVRPAAATTAYLLRKLEGDKQSWYQERQLRSTIRVGIENVATPGDCTKATVLFNAKAAGGSTPDTVYGTWDDARQRCVASARWRLGKEIGTQHLRVALANEPSKQLVFQAGARALPRLVGGLAMVFTSRYDTLVKSSRNVRIERVLPTGEKVSFDTTVNVRNGVGKVSTRVTFSPMFAIDQPLYPRWQHVRWIAGASATRPKDDFFFGVSLLQPFFGIGQEGVGIDAQLIAQVSRRRGLIDAGACATGGSCDTKSTTGIVGAGISLTIDTGGLLTNLLTAFSR